MQNYTPSAAKESQSENPNKIVLIVAYPAMYWLVVLTKIEAPNALVACDMVTNLSSVEKEPLDLSLQNPGTPHLLTIHVLGLHKPHKNMQKLVKITGLVIELLINTGSQISAIREDFH